MSKDFHVRWLQKKARSQSQNSLIQVFIDSDSTSKCMLIRYAVDSGDTIGNVSPIKKLTQMLTPFIGVGWITSWFDYPVLAKLKESRNLPGFCATTKDPTIHVTISKAGQADMHVFSEIIKSTYIKCIPKCTLKKENTAIIELTCFIVRLHLFHISQSWPKYTRWFLASFVNMKGLPRLQ